MREILFRAKRADNGVQTCSECGEEHECKIIERVIVRTAEQKWIESEAEE